MKAESIAEDCTRIHCIGIVDYALEEVIVMKILGHREIVSDIESSFTFSLKRVSFVDLLSRLCANAS